jgi:hypothetical protein
MRGVEMKRNLLVAVFGLTVLLTSCMGSTYDPTFRTQDNVLMYLDAQGEWIILYDFTDMVPLIPVNDGESGDNGEDGISVTAAEINAAQELIFHYSDGQTQNLGCIAPDPQDGVLFETASINAQGELLLQTTNGEVLNLGRVVGPQGPRGPSGPSGPIGATGAQGVQGPIGATGLTVSTSKDEAELFALTAVEDVDIVVIVGNVVVSGLSHQIIDDELILDFGNKIIAGDLTIETPFDGVVELLHGTIDGDLTVSGIYATFHNHLTVTGQITIEAVSENTWNQYGDVNNILITADGGTYNFLDGTIADCIRICGEEKSKTFVFAGAALTAPVMVETKSQIVFAPTIETPVTLNYASETVRQNCCIINNTTMTMVVDGTSETEPVRNTVFIQGKPGTYISIQSGLDAATAGDTVYVGAGEYHEHLTISKALKLVAYDGVTLRNPSVGTETIGISIGANIEGTIIIDGFELHGYRNGIVTRSPAIVRNNTVYAENYGLDNAYLRNGIQVGSTVASANGSIVEYNTVYGAPLTESWAGTAINIVNSSDVIVRHNTVLGDNDIGIGILDFSRVNVSGVQILSNTVIGARNAIRIDGWYTLNPYAVIENIQVDGNELIGNLEDDESYWGINMQWVKVINSAFTTNTFEGFSLPIRVSASSASSENLLSDDIDVQAIINVTQNRAGYHTIQAAIDAAEDGETITLQAGVYEEDVTLDKAITLQGLGEGAVVGIVTITNELAIIDNITYDTQE